jgi:ring-1,2-phenylacetyl-CoA epoxidase subunit PaaD
MVMTSPRDIDEGTVRAVLGEVPDPEIPAVSIVELGMVGAIDVDAARIRVELLPTFVGCPALEVIRDAVTARLAADFDRAVDVEVSFATPWTSDRISPAGREKLRGSGFAPPPHLRSDRALPVFTPRLATSGPADPDDAVSCPYCGSTATTLENAFGPTQCRSIRHCAACRQPFEAFKPI